MKEEEHETGEHQGDKAAQQRQSCDCYALGTSPHLFHHPSMTQWSKSGPVWDNDGSVSRRRHSKDGTHPAGGQTTMNPPPNVGRYRRSVGLENPGQHTALVAKHRFDCNRRKMRNGWRNRHGAIPRRLREVSPAPSTFRFTDPMWEAALSLIGVYFNASENTHHLSTNPRKLNPEGLKYLNSDPLALLNQSEQYVFGADVNISELHCLAQREVEDTLRSWAGSGQVRCLPSSY